MIQLSDSGEATAGGTSELWVSCVWGVACRPLLSSRLQGHGGCSCGEEEETHAPVPQLVKKSSWGVQLMAPAVCLRARSTAAFACARSRRCGCVRVKGQWRGQSGMPCTRWPCVLMSIECTRWPDGEHSESNQHHVRMRECAHTHASHLAAIEMGGAGVPKHALLKCALHGRCGLWVQRRRAVVVLHACVRACVREFLCAILHVCVRVRVCACVHAFLRSCACARLHVRACLHVACGRISPCTRSHALRPTQGAAPQPPSRAACLRGCPRLDAPASRGLGSWLARAAGELTACAERD